MSTETTNKKIKIDNGTTFGRTYTDKAVDERLQGFVSTATFTPVKEKANNSLQKPAGLTKTELVGVGTNGQENIEIGDNLTLANGKLSATGGGSGVEFNELEITGPDTFSGNIDENKVNLITLPGYFKLVGTFILNEDNTKSLYGIVANNDEIINVYKLTQNGDTKTLKGINIPARYYTHFITLTKDNDRIYFQFTDNNNQSYSMSVLSQVISQKKIICTGVLGNSDESLATPLYVSGVPGTGNIEVYYVLKSDTSGTIYNKTINSFTISQSFYPISYQL